MHALKTLEYDLILEMLARHCETPMGFAAAEALEPDFSSLGAWDLLAATQEAYDVLSRESAPALGGVKDDRPALKRAEKGGVLNGQELARIANALAAMRGLKALLADTEKLPQLGALAIGLPSLPRLEEAINDSIDDNGEVKDSASPALGSLRAKKKSSQSRILERIQSYVSGKARDLLSDPIYTVRDGRYVLPLKAENKGKIKGIVHDSSASGQTVYLEPEDVLQLSNALRQIESEEREEVQKILRALSEKLGGAAPQITVGIEMAGRIDLILAKARLAFEMGGALPVRLHKPLIKIEGGRHPLLDREIAVPLNIQVGVGENVLITGPNTGGKTVSIKTVGLFVLMAQSGLFPPARHIEMGLFSQVWADIGDEQSLSQSLSTFSGHIKNIAEALRMLRPNALVLLDEVGAGTDPAEGAALARAILITLAGKGACVLASTHYGELKQFAYETEGFSNAAMEFDTKSLMPTYKLLMGSPGASQAMRIAERYGIPGKVIETAREALSSQQQDINRMMENLETAQKLARTAQAEADRRTAELRRMEEQAKKKLAEADDIRLRANQRAKEAIEEGLRDLRLEAAELFDLLKKGRQDPRAQDRVRKGLASIQAKGEKLTKGFDVSPKQRPGYTPPKLEKGLSVTIRGYSQPGVVLEDPKSGKVQVQVGAVKLTVPVGMVDLAKPVEPKVQKQSNHLRLKHAQHAVSELHIRHYRVDQATGEVEKFLDNAVLAGLTTVRIVHGKGEGVLRNVVKKMLAEHEGVASHRLADETEGGDGVTVVTLK
ncbi:MAG: endonuclease MutS2 [Armatimonadetes bacterium]|nr:endonuclease MutS2 [Armatimonadota bacterium]